LRFGLLRFRNLFFILAVAATVLSRQMIAGVSPVHAGQPAPHLAKAAAKTPKPTATKKPTATATNTNTPTPTATSTPTATPTPITLFSDDFSSHDLSKWTNLGDGNWSAQAGNLQPVLGTDAENYLYSLQAGNGNWGNIEVTFDVTPISGKTAVVLVMRNGQAGNVLASFVLHKSNNYSSAYVDLQTSTDGTLAYQKVSVSQGAANTFRVVAQGSRLVIMQLVKGKWKTLLDLTDTASAGYSGTVELQVNVSGPAPYSVAIDNFMVRQLP